MRKFISIAAALVILAGVQGIRAADGASHASAVVYNAAGEELGVARFTEDATGRVHVNVHVEGLTPGFHGIHLHTTGKCEAPFLSAGGHFNPTGTEHGLENPHGAHAGDLPNLVVNGAGVGHLNTITDRATLTAGPLSVFDADGTAVVIHAGPDDQVSDPAGNSGARVACGVIAEK